MEAIEIGPGENRWQCPSIFQHKKYGASNKARRNQAQNKRNNRVASERTAKLTAKGYLLVLKDFCGFSWRQKASFECSKMCRNCSQFRVSLMKTGGEWKSIGGKQNKHLLYSFSSLSICLWLWFDIRYWHRWTFALIWYCWSYIPETG